MADKTSNLAFEQTLAGSTTLAFRFGPSVTHPNPRVRLRRALLATAKMGEAQCDAQAEKIPAKAVNELNAEPETIERPVGAAVRANSIRK